MRIASMIAVGMNFSFRGYWSAIHLTGIYLRTLLIMHAINIFLNWVLIQVYYWGRRSELPHSCKRFTLLYPTAGFILINPFE